MNFGDTIFALSTAPGKAGIAVIRMSGPGAFSLARLLSPGLKLTPAQVTYSAFQDRTGTLIDRGLLLLFKSPKSFTGEDCVEFHVHGGRAVVDKLLGSIAEHGARPAEPGEFTRRAFENDKLDLTAAEGLADLVDAETEGQRRQAFNQMEGFLGDLYESWRSSLMGALALMEAEIDFADEDLPDDLSQQIYPVIEQTRDQIKDHLNDHRRGERLRDGVRIAIIGAPNVGKSSLINALSRRDVAIVSDVSGTTRDVLEVHLDLGGVPVLLADTAGLRAAGDSIEEEGIRRARQRAIESDLRVFLGDISAPETYEKMSDSDLYQDGDLVVLNKVDLLDHDETPGPTGAARISVQSGFGLDAFVELLSDQVRAAFWPAEAPAITRERHRLALREVSDHLDDLLTHRDRDVALRTETLRLAIRALGRITGRVDVEEMLGLVFSEFCIGK